MSFGLFDNVRVERFVTNAPPFITAQPQSLEVKVGSNATFAVTAGGTGPLAYQWRFNGTNLAGATTSTLARPGVQASSAGDYSVVVSNTAGSVTSSNAVLTIVPLQLLKFELITLLPDQNLRIILSGEPGQSIALHSSTNLSDWVTVTNLMNPTGVIEFTDTVSSGALQRYYRATSP